MGNAEKDIAASICHAILSDGHDNEQSLAERFSGYFAATKLIYTCVKSEHFSALRNQWQIEGDAYRASFEPDENDGDGNPLAPAGDMGFSGSTFFTSHDKKFLIKSVPRHFEHSFFRDELLGPYTEHMRSNPSSLLCRITDFLEPAQHSVGTAFGLGPSHHLVMENIKFGEGSDTRADAPWESYDLKPLSYFYPERDVAGGALTSEETKSKLTDHFDDKLVLDLDSAADLRAQLQKDTALLSSCNAVDYSLFLVRIPVSDPGEPEAKADGAPDLPLEPPLIPPKAPTWSTGVKSADGKWLYRAAVLDFFWAKHKAKAQAMTGLINAYNLVDKQGPMSVTAESGEYRERFLKMCEDMVEVKEALGA